MDVIGQSNKISTSFIFTIYFIYSIHLSFESYVLQVMIFSIKKAVEFFEESKKTAISFYNQNTLLIFSINKRTKKRSPRDLYFYNLSQAKVILNKERS